MQDFRNALLALTREVCRCLDGVEIPKTPVWTVDNSSGGAPHVAMGDPRPALSDLRFRLSIGLLRLPEYGVVAEAVENEPELREGILVDAGGFLAKPERISITRALVTNFLWRYLRQGAKLDWDEPRFDETFEELRTELRRKSVVFHTTLPLSNLKMDIAELDFGDELKLLPASTEELERWLNRDRSWPPLGAGPPQWNTLYVDKPGVLHARRVVEGRPRPTDPQAMLGQVPRFDVDHAITAIRLVLNAPISVLFHENHSDGLMAFGGGGTSWGWSPPQLGTVATLDQKKAAQVIQVWQRLRTSRNIAILTLPLRRWESSLLRPNLEDRLIDAWISMEALLLREKAELSFRAAVRLAEFLGTSGADRKAIYDAARDSYKWRSVIVHGLDSKKLAKRQPLPEAVRLTTEFLRSALLKVLDLPGQFEPAKLEEDLLGRDHRS